MKIKVKQVNNLDIVYADSEMYDVIAPDGKCLDEFHGLDKAIAFAESVTDYITNKPRSNRKLSKWERTDKGDN